jgi:hypothetical protein
MQAVRKVKITLGVGVAVLVALGVVTLSHAPPRVVRVGQSQNVEVGRVDAAVEICQAEEMLPAGVSAIRLSVAAYFGSRIRVEVSSGSRLLTGGKRGADWTSKSVTVPVTPINHSMSNVRLCLGIGPNQEHIYVFGAPAPQRESAVLSSGRPLGHRIGVEYLAAGRASWWSRLLTVARHMGLGRALPGTWVVLLIAALLATVGSLSLWLTVRESSPSARPHKTRSGSALADSRAPAQAPSARPAPARLAPIIRGWRGLTSGGLSRRPRAILARVPTAAWICALIAFLNASAWSLIVPPFEGKDEDAHFAYVIHLAENHALPENGHENVEYAPEEFSVLRALHFEYVANTPQVPAISSVAEQRELTQAIHEGASLQGGGEAGIATSEPPLYYAIQAIPYELARGNMLNQLQLMRFVGALFGAMTALFVFLFLRELLPRWPWAATVGAVCVALQPLFAFMSGSVNPDSMLFAVTAATFLCLARAFRHGLNRSLAVTLGIAIAVGFVTKLNFVGFAFGVYVGLVVLAARETRSIGRKGLLSPVIAACIGALPIALYVLRNVLSNRPTFGIASTGGGFEAFTSLFHQFDYIWQLYLPRLPLMGHYFQGMATYKDIWFDRSVGLYGWLDTMFPTWVDNVALIPAAAVVLLCARELVLRRQALRARLPELGVYAAITLGVLVMVGAASYANDITEHKLAFGEPRYLLPMLPLLGAAVTLAVRGAGRRWGPVAGAAMVILFLGHDIFSQLQVIARYYG